MKSMKTLIISAAVCGAMAFPFTATATNAGDSCSIVPSFAFIFVKSTVCHSKISDSTTRSCPNGYPEDKKLCKLLEKYIEENKIQDKVAH